MVIWKGLGILVPVIAVAVMVAADLIAARITGNSDYYAQHGWVMMLAMFGAAALTYCLHLLLRRQKGRVVIDKATGAEVTLRPSHSLFFIPVQYWPVLMVILGIILAFVGGEK